MNTRSLEFRLGAWYALSMSIAFVCVGAGAFYGLQHYLHTTLRDTLTRRSAQVEQILMEQPRGMTAQSLSDSIEARIAPERNNRFVRVSRRPGAPLYTSGA